MDDEDYGLNTLIDMDGYRFTYESEYWWKIEVRKEAPSKFRPHGIRYNLTFHNNYNTRIFGIDNAHAIKPPKRGFSGKWTVYDHLHKTSVDSGQPYFFVSASQLLEDFLGNVDKIIGEKEGKS